MLSKFLPGHRFFLAALGLVAIAVALAYLVSGLLALLISVVLCAAIWLLRGTVTPSHHGNTKVRLLSLICFFGLIGSFGFWSEFVNSTIAAAASEPMIREWIPWLGKISLGDEPSYAVIGAGLLALIAVNYFLPDRSIPGKHPTPIEEEFPEPRFELKLNAFCSALEQYLVNTDRQANWSPEFYTELEAEVEIQNGIGSSQRKRVANLQRAIRSDRDTQAFLILGDPGSGKSVALRKLARDMLKQVSTTGRVPIYINLREWAHPNAQAGGVWTEQAPPTLRELERFVIERLKNIGDFFTEEFVDQYFHKLWQHGRLFFLFDSFDEIPELLDSSEESWLIESLSTIFSRFIASSPQSRGILASRMFRRPTSAYLAEKVLEIRPLTEESIINSLSRHPEFTEAIKVRLFRDRPDLVPVARNPLLASLLGEWVQTHRDLPANQADLYRDYLLNRLKQCSSKIEAEDLSIQQVFDISQDIAWFVFESPAYGLEAPIQVLSDQAISRHTSAVIDILSYARIARVTTTEPKSFAFSHRRFLEYFVTTKLLSMPDKLPTDHIPTDSRGRDALTLYAQVCDNESASRLVELCWKEINENFDLPAQKIRAIHSLRFLIDAFRMRREQISGYSRLLSYLIHKNISEGDNLIQTKICLEATGLLSDEEAFPLLSSAMSSRNFWLEETAFRACRQLSNISPKLKEQLNYHILKISVFHLWTNRRHFDFNLSLSGGLDKVRKAAKLRIASFAASIFAIFLCLILTPYMALMLFAMSFAFTFLNESIDDSARSPQGDNSSTRFGLGITLNHSFFEKAIGLSRIMLPICFITEALFALLGVSTTSERAIAPEYLSAIESNTWAYAAVYFSLAILMIDWTTLWLFFKKSFPSANAYSLIHTIFSFAIVVLLFKITFDFLNKISIPDFVPIKEIAGFFVVVIAGLSIKSIVKIIIFEIKEHRTLLRMKIVQNMTREDIFLALSSLSSDRRRLAFVRSLGAFRVIPSGDWPAGFSFSITPDIALTELAKLEEQWLGLDR